MGKRKGWGQGVSNVSHYHTPILVIINSSNMSNSNLFCWWQYLVTDLSLSINFSLYFPSLVQLWRGMIGFGGCLECRGGQPTMPGTDLYLLSFTLTTQPLQTSVILYVIELLLFCIFIRDRISSSTSL